MPQKNADELIDRLLNDAEFTKAVADSKESPELQKKLTLEYELSEAKLSEALLHKFPLPDEVLDEIHGGKLSDLSFKRVLKKAIFGAVTGAAVGKVGGPKGALIGAAVGGFGVAGADILEEAIDSLLSWKW